MFRAWISADCLCTCVIVNVCVCMRMLAGFPPCAQRQWSSFISRTRHYDPSSSSPPQPQTSSLCWRRRRTRRKRPSLNSQVEGRKKDHWNVSISGSWRRRARTHAHNLQLPLSHNLVISLRETTLPNGTIAQMLFFFFRHSNGCAFDELPIRCLKWSVHPISNDSSSAHF